MMGRKLQKKYALTDKGLRNTRIGAAWTVVVNLIMMAGMGIFCQTFGSVCWRLLS